MCGYVTLSSRPFQLLVLFFRPSPRPKLSFDQNNQHEQISVSLSWLYFVEKLNFDGYKTLSRRHSGFYFIDPVQYTCSIFEVWEIFIMFDKAVLPSYRDHTLHSLRTKQSIMFRLRFFYQSLVSRPQVHFQTAKMGDFFPLSRVQCLCLSRIWTI